MGRNDFWIGPIGRIGHIGLILAQTNGVEVGDGGQSGIEVSQDENLFAGGVGGGEAGFHGAGVDDRSVLTVVFDKNNLLVICFKQMVGIREPGVAWIYLEVAIFFQVVNIGILGDEVPVLGLGTGAREGLFNMVGDVSGSGGGVEKLGFFGGPDKIGGGGGQNISQNFRQSQKKLTFDGFLAGDP